MLIASTSGTSIPLVYMSSHVHLHQHQCAFLQSGIEGRWRLGLTITPSSCSCTCICHHSQLAKEILASLIHKTLDRGGPVISIYAFGTPDLDPPSYTSIGSCRSQAFPSAIHPIQKELILNGSCFVPTAIEIPVSSITSLSLAYAHHHQPSGMGHTLGLLRSTLERLEVNNIAEELSLIIETVQLPRLTCLKRWRANPSRHTVSHPVLLVQSPNYASRLCTNHILWVSPTVYFPSCANSSHRGGLASNLSLGGPSKSSTI